MAFFILIFVAAIALKIRQRVEYKIDIKEDEIVSYEVLNNIELGIYSDIKNSLVDISQLRDEQNSLPSLDLLVEEEIPPYFKDITWEQRGAVEWTAFKHDGEDYFIGKGNGKVGTFLVKFNNENMDESDIFYMKETPSFNDIEKNFEKYEHIAKKIVPFTGNDERRKLTGE
ncbi:hypothetical protein LDJ89_09945 [Fusobacterium nucleatum]